MKITVNTAGLDALRQRIADARAQLPTLLDQAVQDAGEMVATELSAAAPKGKSEGGTPLPGDAPGPLSQSFFVQPESPPSSVGAAITVRTSQPLKLKIIVEGRKSIVPTAKAALYWEGLPHPVKFAKATEPNDFVSPVLSSAPDAQEVLSWVAGDIAMILEGA